MLTMDDIRHMLTEAQELGTDTVELPSKDLESLCLELVSLSFTPFERGRDAYRRGVDPDAGPSDHGTASCVAWDAGWEYEYERANRD